MIRVGEDDVDERFAGIANGLDHRLTLIVRNMVIEPAPEDDECGRDFPAAPERFLWSTESQLQERQRPVGACPARWSPQDHSGSSAGLVPQTVQL